MNELDLHTPLKIGNLTLPHRLIQGPLAGYSCAPMREQFAKYQNPAYAVTEMISAKDILNKHQPNGRYLYKSPNEGLLGYQIAGCHVQELVLAAQKCEAYGANLIDLNCGCPKEKMKKKGYGSALLNNPIHLQHIVTQIKSHINIPLTVKIRIQSPMLDQELVKRIGDAGADAIIVHGRTADEDYDIPCNYAAIKRLKACSSVPLIANGDIMDLDSLQIAIRDSQADAWMISRAGCGQPWLYQMLLNKPLYQPIEIIDRIELFICHLNGLKALENEFKALLQARSLIHYYFRPFRKNLQTTRMYQLLTIQDLKQALLDNKIIDFTL